jgi:hypothetical protein
MADSKIVELRLLPDSESFKDRDVVGATKRTVIIEATTSMMVSAKKK